MTLTVPKVHWHNTLEGVARQKPSRDTYLKIRNFLAPRQPETFASNETTEQRCRN